MEHKKHSEQFEIQFYHIDKNGYVSLQSIANFMQAVITKHGRVLGANIENLSEHNLTWAFSRFHIKIDSFPRCFDTVTFSTWRSLSKGCFAYREFEGFNANNNLFCSGTASAALIDLDSRKPVNVPEFIQKQFAPELGRAIEDDFEKLPGIESPDIVKDFAVRLSDIDLNGHVNNASYIDWIIESLPGDVLLNCRFKEIEINYRAEVFYGESIVSKSSRVNDTTFIHELSRKGEKRIITLARTRIDNMNGAQ